MSCERFVLPRFDLEHSKEAFDRRDLAAVAREQGAFDRGTPRRFSMCSHDITSTSRPADTL
jgi:hypothetical protein